MAFTPFDEIAGSPVFNFRPYQTTAKRMGIIPGNRIGDMLNELFPVGLQPASFSTEYPWLIAQGLMLEPLIGEQEKIVSPTPADLPDPYLLSTINTYTWLKATIEYGTQQPGQTPEEQGEDPVALLEHRWSAGGEFITIPSGGYEWSDGGDITEDVDFGLLIPHFDMSIRWPRVESPPFAAIRSTIGKVNSANVNFRTGVCAPETLLFQGAELSRAVLTTGALAWDVTYRFGERRVPAAGGGVGGWNHFFRSEYDSATATTVGVLLPGSEKTGFYKIQVRSGRSNAGENPYQTANFAALFQEAS